MFNLLGSNVLLSSEEFLKDSVLGVTRRSPRKHRKHSMNLAQSLVGTLRVLWLHLPLGVINTRPTTPVGFLPCCSRAGPLPASSLLDASSFSVWNNCA